MCDLLSTTSVVALEHNTGKRTHTISANKLRRFTIVTALIAACCLEIVRMIRQTKK